MQPVETESTNLILTAPEGQEHSVGNLPVTRYELETPDGKMPCLMSCWELDTDEIEIIKKTGRIYFHTYGTTHPPIMITPVPIEEMVDVEIR